MSHQGATSSVCRTGWDLTEAGDDTPDEPSPETLDLDVQVAALPDADHQAADVGVADVLPARLRVVALQGRLREAALADTQDPAQNVVAAATSPDS